MFSNSVWLDPSPELSSVMFRTSSRGVNWYVVVARMIFTLNSCAWLMGSLNLFPSSLSTDCRREYGRNVAVML